MRKLSITLMTAAAFMILGCVGSPAVKNPGALLTWGDDAANLQVCGPTTIVNCKAAYELFDLTTQTSMSVPLSAKCVTTAAADDFQIRVVGYDKDGVLIYSPWVVATKIVDPAASLICSAPASR